MRTALLTYGYPPTGSGLGRAAQTIAEALAGAGADVTVFIADWDAGRTETDGALTLTGCAPAGAVARARRLAVLGHLAAPLAFRTAVRQATLPFDVIEATNWYAPAALLVGGKTPVVVRNSTPASDARHENMSRRDAIDLSAAHKIEARTARNADALISNTATHRDLIERIYDLRGRVPHRVIGLALDPAFLAAGATASPPPRAGGALFIGRDEARKGFREMIGAYALIRAGQSAASALPLKLTVVGVEEDLVAALLQQEGLAATEDVRVLSRVTDDQLAALYRDARIVLAPSRYESYGLVYREAAAFGRPLVACAEDPAARAFVATAKCGVLAERCTPEAIAEAVQTVLASDVRIAELSQHGRAHARDLTRETLARQTLDVYRGVVSTASLSA